MRVGRSASLPPLKDRIMMQNAAGGIKIYSFMLNGIFISATKPWRYSRCWSDAVGIKSW
jgi:hypothetical protein